MSNSDLTTLIAGAVDGTLGHGDVMSFCGTAGVTIDQLFNRLAVTIARAFDDGAMSFDDADAAANTIYARMIDELVRVGDGYELPEPAFSIYIAFDEGEYEHQAGENPVETHTRPQIRALLAADDGHDDGADADAGDGD